MADNRSDAAITSIVIQSVVDGSQGVDKYVRGRISELQFGRTPKNNRYTGNSESNAFPCVKHTVNIGHREGGWEIIAKEVREAWCGARCLGLGLGIIANRNSRWQEIRDGAKFAMAGSSRWRDIRDAHQAYAIMSSKIRLGLVSDRILFHDIHHYADRNDIKTQGV